MPSNPMGNVVGFFFHTGLNIFIFLIIISGSRIRSYFYTFLNYYSIDLKLMLNLHNFFFASVKDIKSQVNLHNFYLPSESLNKFTY